MLLDCALCVRSVTSGAFPTWPLCGFAAAFFWFFYAA